MTAKERAEHERRSAQRFERGARVRVVGEGGAVGTVVDSSYEAPDSYMRGFRWLGRLLGRPEPQKRWYYQVHVDGHALPGNSGSWYSPDLLEPAPG
jgi:hypothetical protein